MVPEGDLAHIKYETRGFKASQTIILVSTPRSGSTMLSADIDHLDGGPMAECCQPFQIIPYLMSMRPQITDGDKLDLAAYANYLVTTRSGRSEKLFINIHASHVDIFKKLQVYLPPVSKTFLLFRRDVIAQAVSYYIASKTGQWSSSYVNNGSSVPFFPNEITGKLLTVCEGAFKNYNAFSASSESIFYEDYLIEEKSFAQINNVRQSTQRETSVYPQSTKMNKDFIEEYTAYLQENGNERIRSLLDSYSTLMTLAGAS